MRFGWFDHAAFIIFAAYACGSVVIPVALVELSRDLGFSLAEGGLSAGGALHLGRTIPMILTMLLSGFMAGRWGLRRTLGWSVLLMAAGLGLCALAPVYGILFLALMIAGSGEGVIEGIATPFIQRMHPGESGRYINFTHSFWSIGILFTVLGAGALLSLGVSWRIIVAVVALLAITPALMLLIPSRGLTAYPEHPEPLHWKTVRGHLLEIIKIPRFWLYYAAMFLAGGGEFCLTFWSASYIQLSFNPAPWAGGVGTGFFAAGMVLGRTGWGYLIKQHQLSTLVIVSALGGTAVTLFFPILTNLWLFFGLLFVAGVATAPFWPSIQSYSGDRLTGVDTTMLLILLSCAGIPGCGFMTWLMGYIGNQSGGLEKAFYLVPICYILIAVLMIYDRVFPCRACRELEPDIHESNR
jgi:fucose permease